ncbi:MAG: hypothetical protein JNM50_04060 [Chromatiales bacterium]|nr:hypothetical protein [Chromatiales bacterium]
MRSRRTQHRDGNEPAIVQALEACGFVVERLPGGGGVPDLLASRAGRWHLAEVKNPAGRNRTEQTQRAFQARHLAPVVLLRTADDVQAFAGSVP